jgi:hypothetical protein
VVVRVGLLVRAPVAGVGGGGTQRLAARFLLAALERLLTPALLRLTGLTGCGCCTPGCCW